MIIIINPFFYLLMNNLLLIIYYMLLFVMTFFLKKQKLIKVMITINYASLFNYLIYNLLIVYYLLLFVVYGSIIGVILSNEPFSYKTNVTMKIIIKCSFSMWYYINDYFRAPSSETDIGQATVFFFFFSFFLFWFP